jgi:hypothetical protein
LARRTGQARAAAQARSCSGQPGCRGRMHMGLLRASTDACSARSGACSCQEPSRVHT